MSHRSKRLSPNKGSVAVLTLFAIIPIIGFMGYVIDTGNRNQIERQLQTAADASAFAGSLQLRQEDNTANATTAAQQLLDKNLSQIPSDVNVTATDKDGPVKIVPKGSLGHDVIVSIEADVPTYFAKVVGISYLKAKGYAKATALQGSTQTTPCLVASCSDPKKNEAALTINGGGNANFNWPSCGLSSNGSIDLNGNQTLTVAGITYNSSFDQGQWTVDSGSTPQSGKQTDDPFANIQTADFSKVCNEIYTKSRLFIGGDLTPGVHCVQNGAQGSLSAIRGNGVSLYVEGDFNIPAGSNFSAPTSGTMADVAVYGTGSSTVSGNDTLTIGGVIYFPNGSFVISGNPNISNPAGGCFQIIACTITLNGSINLAPCTTSSSPSTTTGSAVLIQ